MINKLDTRIGKSEPLPLLVKELKHKKEIPTVIEYQGRRYVLDHGNK